MKQELELELERQPLVREPEPEQQRLMQRLEPKQLPLELLPALVLLLGLLQLRLLALKLLLPLLLLQERALRKMQMQWQALAKEKKLDMALLTCSVQYYTLKRIKNFEVTSSSLYIILLGI